MNLRLVKHVHHCMSDGWESVKGAKAKQDRQNTSKSDLGRFAGCGVDDAVGKAVAHLMP